MKYKSGIGESMVKPSKKQKKTLLIVGITGVVYASFKYLLPLVVPFLVAYLIALALRPSAEWIGKKCRFTVKNRVIGIPVGIAGGLELLIIVVLIGAALYFGGQKLCQEARLLSDQIPYWVESLDIWLTSKCHWMENAFKLKPDCLVILAREMLLGLARTIKDTTMPFLFINSVTLFKWILGAVVVTVILFVAVMLCLQEMDSLRKRRDNSVFRKEFALLSTRLVSVGHAYLRTQGSILLLTISICITGLFLLGNPYYIMLGISIGILDALPVFGTGTAFIPWAVFLAIRGQWGRAAVLIVIYLVCYFLRQYMEAKLMGNRVGLSPLETLVSMYVGLQLFGLIGFLLGPVGLLIISDLVDAYDRD